MDFSKGRHTNKTIFGYLFLNEFPLRKRQAIEREKN